MKDTRKRNINIVPSPDADASQNCSRDIMSYYASLRLPCHITCGNARGTTGGVREAEGTTGREDGLGSRLLPPSHTRLTFQQDTLMS